MRYSSWLLAATLLLSACSAAPIATQRLSTIKVSQASQHLYPVVPGTVWEYQTRQKRNDGSFSERWMKMRISSAQEVGDGITEAVLEREFPSLKVPPTRVRVHPDKVALSRLSSPPDGPSMTIMKLPPVAGESWPGRPYADGNKETVLPQGWEDVTVPAGTFRAWRIDQKRDYAQGGSDILNYWYAPGVGTVKMVERLTLWMGPEPTHMEVTASLTAVKHETPEGFRSERATQRGTPGLWLFPDGESTLR